jgi:hypothetical protein
MVSETSGFKGALRKRLTVEQIDHLKRLYRRSQHAWLRTLHSKDLRRMGDAFAAGKYDWYYPAYERHFGALRDRRLNILEIGIGGYDTSAAGGGSLRMWECYFPHAKIYGLDIYDKSPHDAGRVRTFRGSQADESFLRTMVQQIGPIDIVIDDGSHINEHVRKSFDVLFPLVADNGIYVIEDTHSSYWESFGGSSTDLKRDDTGLGLVKGLLDALNHREIRDPLRQPGPFDSTVVELHCYHNIVFIQKGHNVTVCALGADAEDGQDR